MMRDNRKFWFGLAMGLPFLLSSHTIAMAAIEAGRDLTATGALIASISLGVGGLVGVFVYGNVKEHQAKAG